MLMHAIGVSLVVWLFLGTVAATVIFLIIMLRLGQQTSGEE